MKSAATALLLTLFLCPAWPARVWGAAEKPTVRIGSKQFTEGVILGEMLTALAREAGAEAAHVAELGGTQALWQALGSGKIDAYVEYTGTLREAIFGGKLSSTADEETLRDLVRAQGIGMSAQLGFSNTYALGMREERAECCTFKRFRTCASTPS